MNMSMSRVSVLSVLTLILGVGINTDTATEADYRRLVEVMAPIRDYVSTFDNTNFLTTLPNGEVCAVNNWSGDYGVAKARAAEANAPIEGSARRVEAKKTTARKPRSGTRTRRSSRKPPSSGRPSHMHSVRKVSGGKPVTPNFMTGQFRPQTTVSRTSRTSCWRERCCIRAILGGCA